MAKPDSLLELSCHDKVIALMEMPVALRFDGAAGLLTCPPMNCPYEKQV
jgi:hypothetical protein